MVRVMGDIEQFSVLSAACDVIGTSAGVLGGQCLVSTPPPPHKMCITLLSKYSLLY